MRPLQLRIWQDPGGFSFYVEAHWDGRWHTLCAHDSREAAYQCGGVRHEA